MTTLREAAQAVIDVDDDFTLRPTGQWETARWTAAIEGLRAALAREPEPPRPRPLYSADNPNDLRVAFHRLYGHEPEYVPLGGREEGYGLCARDEDQMEILADILRGAASRDEESPGQTFEERLQHLSALPENWDSYGAPKITPEAIAAARVWFTGLQVIPRSNGGLHIGHDEPGQDVLIAPDGTFEAGRDEESEPHEPDAATYGTHNETAMCLHCGDYIYFIENGWCGNGPCKRKPTKPSAGPWRVARGAAKWHPEPDEDPFYWRVRRDDNSLGGTWVREVEARAVCDALNRVSRSPALPK